MKYEWRKKDKDIYLPKTKPTIVTIPEFTFLTISGVGNPNEEMYGKKVQALYSYSYKIKMSSKKNPNIKDYYDYTVFPLEGIWTLHDIEKGFSKDNLAYKIMIRQADYLNDEIFQLAKKDLSSDNPYLNEVKIEKITDGLCVQMLHLGPFDTEQQSFDKMTEFIEENNLTKTTKIHREIYLSDPRRTEPEKLKTVLRYFVK